LLERTSPRCVRSLSRSSYLASTVLILFAPAELEGLVAVA